MSYVLRGEAEIPRPRPDFRRQHRRTDQLHRKEPDGSRERARAQIPRYFDRAADSAVRCRGSNSDGSARRIRSRRCEPKPGREPPKPEPNLTIDERAKISRLQGDLMWLVREGYVTEFIDGRLFAPPPVVEARKKEIENEEHDPENFPRLHLWKRWRRRPPERRMKRRLRSHLHRRRQRRLQSKRRLLRRLPRQLRPRHPISRLQQWRFKRTLRSKRPSRRVEREAVVGFRLKRNGGGGSWAERARRRRASPGASSGASVRVLVGGRGQAAPGGCRPPFWELVVEFGRTFSGLERGQSASRMTRLLGQAAICLSSELALSCALVAFIQGVNFFVIEHGAKHLGSSVLSWSGLGLGALSSYSQAHEVPLVVGDGEVEVECVGRKPVGDFLGPLDGEAPRGNQKIGEQEIVYFAGVERR